MYRQKTIIKQQAELFDDEAFGDVATASAARKKDKELQLELDVINANLKSRLNAK